MIALPKVTEANCSNILQGFISSTWRVTSKGMFAGSCIGVIFLVCALEFIRRLSREYDRYITLQDSRGRSASKASETGHAKGDAGMIHNQTKSPVHAATRASSSSDDNGQNGLLSGERRQAPFRPTLLQQTIRAALHMVQFGVAYFVMLLAMYYNGYFIICILIGAFIGAFAFSWDIGGKGEEVSGCCG